MSLLSVFPSMLSLSSASLSATADSVSSSACDTDAPACPALSVFPQAVRVTACRTLYKHIKTVYSRSK